MSDQPRLPISVVVPTYRAARFLQATLDSVLQQEQLPAEIVVVDDASPDDTLACIDQVAARSPIPIRVICLPENTGGPSIPLNVGIEAARHPLIATLDHDDRYQPDWLRRASMALQRHGDLPFAFSRITLAEPLPEMGEIDRRYARIRSLAQPGNLPETFRLPRQRAYALTLEEQCYACSCSSFVFRKELWEQIGGFDPRIRICTDYRFLQKVAARCDLLFLDQASVIWNWSPATLYKRTELLRVADDLYRVYVGYQPALLAPELQATLRNLCRGAGLDQADRLLSMDLLRPAWKRTLQSLRHGHPGRRGLTTLLQIARKWLSKGI